MKLSRLRPHKRTGLLALTGRLDVGVGLVVVVRRKTYIQTKFLKYPMTSLLILTREWRK